MLALKHLHMSLAILSVAGFFIRGLWHLQNARYVTLTLTKVLPHIIDSALLMSALALLYIYQWNPFSTPWLTAKLCALVIYIGLGIVAFRVARRPAHKALAWLGALLAAGYILSVAITKSPLPFV